MEDVALEVVRNVGSSALEEFWPQHRSSQRRLKDRQWCVGSLGEHLLGVAEGGGANTRSGRLASSCSPLLVVAERGRTRRAGGGDGGDGESGRGPVDVWVASVRTRSERWRPGGNGGNGGSRGGLEPWTESPLAMTLPRMFATLLYVEPDAETEIEAEVEVEADVADVTGLENVGHRLSCDRLWHAWCWCSRRPRFRDFDSALLRPVRLKVARARARVWVSISSSGSGRCWCLIASCVLWRQFFSGRCRQHCGRGTRDGRRTMVVSCRWDLEQSGPGH